MSVTVAPQFRGLVADLIPRNWELRPITVWLRESMQADAYVDPVTKVIWAPPITNLTNLWIFCHEVGHIKLRHSTRRLSPHREEYEAWKFAWDTLSPLISDRPRARSKLLADARERVRQTIESDILHGHPIAPDVEFWAA